MTAPVATVRTCQFERQVLVSRTWWTELCAEYTCGDKDFCEEHSAQCNVCLEHFGVADPSDPDNQQCPDCAADY